MTGGDPVGLIGLAALALGWFALLLALLATLRRADAGEGEPRSWLSRVGIALQAIGIAFVFLGPIRVTLEPLSAKALVEAVVVAALMAGAVVVFVWAARTLGRDWSLVARTRTDHRLVVTGPFAYVRHPIYVALFAVILATALALGHAGQLVFALPLYALGTFLRVRAEERMLRLRFDAAYQDYAGRVTRFMPGLF